MKKHLKDQYYPGLLEKFSTELKGWLAIFSSGVGARESIESTDRVVDFAKSKTYLYNTPINKLD